MNFVHDGTEFKSTTAAFVHDGTEFKPVVAAYVHDGQAWRLNYSPDSLKANPYFRTYTGIQQSYIYTFDLTSVVDSVRPINKFEYEMPTASGGTYEILKQQPDGKCSIRLITPLTGSNRVTFNQFYTVFDDLGQQSRSGIALIYERPPNQNPLV